MVTCVWEPRKQISYQSAACNTLIATKTARRCFVLGQHVPILDGELHSIAAPTPLLRGILAFLAHACAPPSSKPSCIFSDRSRPGPPSRRRPKRWTDMERSICRRWGRWACGGASLVRGEEAGTCFLYTTLCTWSRIEARRQKAP
jgi:hypothetical protein